MTRQEQEKFRPGTCPNAGHRQEREPDKALCFSLQGEAKNNNKGRGIRKN